MHDLVEGCFPYHKRGRGTGKPGEQEAHYQGSRQEER